MPEIRQRRRWDKDRMCNLRGRVSNIQQPSSWHWPLLWPTVTRDSAFKLLNCKLEPWHFQASVQGCYLQEEWQFAKRNQKRASVSLLQQSWKREKGHLWLDVFHNHSFLKLGSVLHRKAVMLCQSGVTVGQVCGGWERSRMFSCSWLLSLTSSCALIQTPPISRSVLPCSGEPRKWQK